MKLNFIKKQLKFISMNVLLIVFVLFIFAFGGGIVLTSIQPIGRLLINDVILDKNHETEDITEIIDATETLINGNVPYKYKISTLHAGVMDAMGKKYIKDIDPIYDIYKMNNGQLTFFEPEVDTSNLVEKMHELEEYFKKSDTEFIYVQAPHKINKNENLLPYGIDEYANQNADEFLQGIMNKGVRYIDLRETLPVDISNYQSMFFNTDHHWKYTTALYAASETIEYLKRNNLFDLKLDALKENFEVKIIKNALIGAQGQRVGIYYGGIDDMEVPLLENNSEFHVTLKDPEGNIQEIRNGKFNDVIYDNDRVMSINVELNNYHGILNGDGCAEIINDDGIGKILVIKDSFGTPYVAYLSVVFNEVVTCDLRNTDPEVFAKVLRDKYDMVIIIYNPSMYSNSNMFEFGIGGAGKT